MVINVKEIADICPEYVEGIQKAFEDIWNMNNAPGKANIGRDLVQQSIGLTFGQGQGPAFFEKEGCTRAATKNGRTSIEYVPFVTSSLMVTACACMLWRT